MRKNFLLAAVLMSALAIAACDKGGEPDVKPTTPVVTIDISEPTQAPTEAPSVEPSEEPEEVDTEVKEGFYKSELTNEWIDESLKNQRPMAIMVDNELTALDHYGLNASADVVYEIMNSTENDRVTRLMVIVKDWTKLTQFGSIRSVRPTNFMLAAEYNAVLLHDGGPYYINDYIDKGYAPNISGGFARFSNGKPTEFTEYITYDKYTNPSTGKSYDGLKQRLSNTGISSSYTLSENPTPFKFTVSEQSLKDKDGAFEVNSIKINAFKHNKSSLSYNSETGLYEYSTYGKQHIDPLDDKRVLTFKNLIIQDTDFTMLGSHGYLVYNLMDGASGEGYYISEGYGIPITWSKEAEDAPTVYYNKATGKELKLNTGRTYIALVPSDDWDNVEYK